MKLCFPIDDFKGMDSKISHHFGAAPCFLIYNLDTDESGLIFMQDLQTEGSCNPSLELAKMGVDIVITSGIGPGALHKLMDSGVHAFMAMDGVVSADLENFRNNLLTAYGYDSGKCDCEK